MAGIYIHVPFCRKACNYCDFHFSTNLKVQDELVNALIMELEMRKDYLNELIIETLYFGGGTPSLLSRRNLEDLFNTIYKNYTLIENPEITLEANPDDLNKDSIIKFQEIPINRFSVGIQSFFEEDLVWMNRSHNAEQAKSGIKNLQDGGYTNISLDLIFGYALLNMKKWKKNIRTALELKVPHISSYGMTLEKGTLLGNQNEKGIYQEIDEEAYLEQYRYLLNKLEDSGFEAYEISNFAIPGYESRHNSNYWNQISYLGIGPSAHSFNGWTRSWNISNNPLYIQGISKGKPLVEEEKLSQENHFNEYVLTSLRTRKGISLNYVEVKFSLEKRRFLESRSGIQIQLGNLQILDNHLILTQKGKFISDKIVTELI